MINCPNCNHQNPDGALQCEACYTPLPALANCPNCNASIQADASFCGQCGSDLREENLSPSTSQGIESAPTQAVFPQTPEPESEETAAGASNTQNFLVPPQSTPQSTPQSSTEPERSPDLGIPDLVAPDPLIIPAPISSEESAQASESLGTELSASGTDLGTSQNLPDVLATPSGTVEPETSTEPASMPSMETPSPAATPSTTGPMAEPVTEPVAEPPPAPFVEPAEATPPTPVPAARRSPATQLQVASARLQQVQTNTLIELPRGLSVVRIGKPNDHTPPDIDVSGFPDSEIVSRVHANIRVEGDTYFLEDVGSSNGTYINGLPLPVGNRHRLRPGDRIAFGKGDKVSFIFEISS